MARKKKIWQVRFKCGKQKVCPVIFQFDLEPPSPSPNVFYGLVPMQLGNGPSGASHHSRGFIATKHYPCTVEDVPKSACQSSFCACNQHNTLTLFGIKVLMLGMRPCDRGAALRGRVADKRADSCCNKSAARSRLPGPDLYMILCSLLFISLPSLVLCS